MPGNHDEYSYPKCVYRLQAGRWPGTLVSQPSPGRVAVWELAGIQVDLYSMAFVAGRSVPPFDRFDVPVNGGRRMAVLHGSLDVPDWGDRSIPLRSSNLESMDFDYIALGHIHRPFEKRLGRGWVCYPGRIEGGGFDDPGGADLVTIDFSAADPAPIHTSFPCARIEEESWNLSGVHEPSELDARLESAADPGRILRLRLTGMPGFRLDTGHLQSWAGRFRHLEIVAEEEPIPESLEELAAEKTVRGAFVELALKKRAAAGTPEERRKLEAALRHGLAAFAGTRTGEPQ